MDKLCSWCITHTHTHTPDVLSPKWRNKEGQRKNKTVSHNNISIFRVAIEMLHATNSHSQPPFKYLNTIFRFISNCFLPPPFWLQLNIFSIHWQNRLHCLARPWISLCMYWRCKCVSATHYTIQWLRNSKLNAMKFSETFRWTRLHAAMQFPNAKFRIVKYINKINNAFYVLSPWRFPSGCDFFFFRSFLLAL